MATKIAVYVRVSTSDQDVSMQIHDLNRYAAARGYEVVDTFSDVGVSGSRETRPALDRLMDGARKRKFDAVLVWRFDRFARNSRHFAIALDEFKKLDIQFISYNENIDTGTPMGQAMFTIISAMAQLERDIIKERVVAGIRAAQRKGIHCGRKPLITDRDKVRALKAAGKSYRKIAKECNISLGSVQKILKAA